MDFLYSLYDALVSINVPSDKARAVVDAMERDMGTTLATKSDLQPLASREDMLLVKQDLRGLASRDELLQVRQELKGLASRDELLQVKQDLAALRQDFQAMDVRFQQRLDLLRSEMTIRLGTMLFVSMGLLFAALRIA